jgi:hypothetical protein
MRALAIALETTNGTAASYSASDATTRIFDPKITANIEKITRERIGFGQGQGNHGARGATATFSHELYGKGATGTPQQLRFFQCAGFSASSGILTADPTANQTGTIAMYQDGRLRTCFGAMGTGTITGVNGQPAVVSWTFTGKYSTPTTATILAPTRDTTIAPRCASATITIGGNSYKFPQWELDLGNEVTLREDQSDLTGYLSAFITNRKPVLKLSPEGSTSKIWDADFLASTEAAFSCAIGTASNNTITITATKLELAAPAEDEDRNGVFAEGLTFNLNDDNLVITYS